MSTIKADAITASTGTNTNIGITGKGSGKVAIGDGTLLFPDADGSANQYIKTDGSANLEFATLPTAGFTVSAESATTSGSTVTISGVPSGTTVIYVMWANLSTNGTGNIGIQIGDSGGVETAGYEASNTEAFASIQANSPTDMFGFITSSIAANNYDGMAVLTLKDSTNNTWTYMCISSDNSTENQIGAGHKSLSGTLTSVSLFSDNTFDAGDFSISYL